MTVSPYEPSDVMTRNTPMGQSVLALRDWAEAARAAYQVAQSLCKTSFVPKEYRGKPEEATAAILAGNELGFSPIASINAFSPIQGTAAPKALTLRAVVQARGHEIEVLETNPNRCVIRGRRRGSDEWQTVTWTIDRARQLKLTQREQWRTQPQNMLVARATSEICRLIAADAILGIPYSAEELGDQGAEETAAQPTPGRARRRPPVHPAMVTTDSIRAGREQRAASLPSSPPSSPSSPSSPPLPGEAGYAPDDAVPPARSGAEATAASDDDRHDDQTSDADDAAAPDGDVPDYHDGSSPVRMRRLFALIRDIGIDDRHQWASEVLERNIETYHELDADDIEKLIERLEDNERQDEGR